MAAKYRQIADSLTKRIRGGELERGSRLPGENDLAHAYEVSRSTIRQALASLQEAGLIETWTGAGSFVCYDGAYLNDQLGWSRALAQQGVETTARILRLDRVIDAALAREISVDDSTFLALDRVRSTVFGEAISLERSRLPWRQDFVLGRSTGDGFLATRRTVHDAAGAVVERVDSLLHPDHFRLQFNFGDRPP